MVENRKFKSLGWLLLSNLDMRFELNVSVARELESSHGTEGYARGDALQWEFCLQHAVDVDGT